MKKYKIPTAEFEQFTDPQKALEHVYMSRFPIVIKADGLAAGKGVTVARSLVEARRAIKAALEEKVFGDSGAKIIIEEFMEGDEASILAFCDGKNFISMVSAQDHKTVFDNDQGPNTGGMGTYSPAPLVTATLAKEIDEKVFKPMLDGLAADGMPYVGVLYAGLMITKDGPKVVEFNCRFGDPETQVVLPRLNSDLADIMNACVDGKISEQKILWTDKPAVCVVLAAEGYPGNYKKGIVINGLSEVAQLPETMVFDAGTVKDGNNIVTSGGRVLGITALGNDLRAAIKNTYVAVNKIKFEGMHYRKDIGQKALKYLK